MTKPSPRVVNGKGSGPRITDRRAFNRNLDEVDWQHPPVPPGEKKFSKVYGPTDPGKKLSLHFVEIPAPGDL